MDQPDLSGPSLGQPITANPTLMGAPTSSRAGSCPTCGTGAQSNLALGGSNWVYSIGRVDFRFKSPGTEKELAQVMGRSETVGLTDRQALRKVLQDRQNRYLVRQLCWVMTIEGLETYIITPRDPMDFDLLVETLRPSHSPADLDVLIGLRGPLASPDMCNGLIVPIVAFDALYSFDRASLIKAIPRPEKVPAKEFVDAAEELFSRLMQMTSNTGSTDEHRAINYLLVKYPPPYWKTAEAFAANASLTSVEVRPSALSGTRKIVEVIFSYTNRSTDVIEKYFVRVDVTEEFPYLVTKLSAYYDR
jgi:hypothetical protein